MARVLTVGNLVPAPDRRRVRAGVRGGGARAASGRPRGPSAVSDAPGRATTSRSPSRASVVLARLWLAAPRPVRTPAGGARRTRGARGPSGAVRSGRRLVVVARRTAAVAARVPARAGIGWVNDGWPEYGPRVDQWRALPLTRRVDIAGAARWLFFCSGGAAPRRSGFAGAVLHPGVTRRLPARAAAAVGRTAARTWAGSTSRRASPPRSRRCATCRRRRCDRRAGDAAEERRLRSLAADRRSPSTARSTGPACPRSTRPPTRSSSRSRGPSRGDSCRSSRWRSGVR